MKKSVIGFIFGVILTLSVSVAADTYYQFAKSDNTLYVDGTKIEMPLYNYQYTNHAPIRAIAEALGLDITVEGTRIDFTSKSLETVAKNCKDSCVMIYAYHKDGALQGSGWIYNGYVITAKHGIEGASEIHVFTDDSTYGVYGTIHYIDDTLDVAVLKADTKMPSVELGDSDKLIEGEKLVSITSPEGVKNLIEECVYSNTNTFSLGEMLAITDSSMIGGSSGGAIFGYDSNIVAMMVGRADNIKDLISAIPINDIKPILEKLK